MTYLAKIYNEGIKVDRDIDQTIHWFEEALSTNPNSYVIAILMALYEEKGELEKQDEMSMKLLIYNNSVCESNRF